MDPWGCKESDMTEQLNTYTHRQSYMLRTGVTSAAVPHLCHHEEITETSLGCLPVGGGCDTTYIIELL